jgi:dTDP-glucose pyrophosphorylase
VKAERLSLAFAVQQEARGTADAVASAEDFVGGDDFLCINGDNFYPRAALEGLRGLSGSGLVGFEKASLIAESNIPADRINRFAAAESNGNGHLRRIIEKPDAATAARLGSSALISMNCWRFGGRIFEACRSIGLSPRGELELTDAVQYSIDRLGEEFAVLPLRLGVLDLTSRDDVGPVAERLRGMAVRL